MTPPQPDRPTFEGRALPRPDDEVVDQGLAFDLGTLFDRRRALQVLGIGVAGGALAACGSSSTSSGASASSTASASASATSTASADGDLVEIPDETAGPYPGDGSNGADVLEQSGVVRQDITSSFGDSTTTAPGIPMQLRLTVLDIRNGGAPMVGAAVYVWQCDSLGQYSMYSEAVQSENYLRGVQVTDDSGVVTFDSLFPGCYSGRWPHIHVEVYPDEASITDSTNAIATSQVALPQNACETVYRLEEYTGSTQNLSRLTLATDNVFGDDGGVHQLGTTTGDTTSGYAVALTVPVDTSTEPTGGSMAGDGGPGGGGPDGTPPAPPSS